MELRLRREWIWMLAGMGVGLLVLLAWAWADGGIEPVRAISAPAMLPGGGA